MYIIIKAPSTIIDSERDVPTLTNRYCEEPLTIGSFNIVKKSKLSYREIIVHKGTITIDNITEVKDLLKEEYKDIKSVIFKEPLKYIDEYALCKRHLESVTLPNTYVEQSNACFSNVDRLVFPDLEDLPKLTIEHYLKCGVKEIHLKNYKFILKIKDLT